MIKNTLEGTVVILLAMVLVVTSLNAENKPSAAAPEGTNVLSNLSGLKSPSHARIPGDMPLDAVKWTGGFWQDRMRRLRDIYLPGVLDGSFMSVENGATFRNLLRAAGLEEGGALACTWSDGDCYMVLDTVSRLYAYRQDEYLKGRLDYWIPIIARVQQADGLVDTRTVLKRFDAKDGKVWGQSEKQRQAVFQGLIAYNTGHLYTAARTYQRATGDDRFLVIADKAMRSYLSRGSNSSDGFLGWAFHSLYARTGEQRYLESHQGIYTRGWAPFGPRLREADEVYGHNTVTAHFLTGATALYDRTGEQALLDALVRLATNMLAKKTYITGAVAPVFKGERPEQVVNGKKYPALSIQEAVGVAYDLPNDGAYCESCGQCLYMEWYYQMFRLTGQALYMDAAERALYNTVPGCVDLDRPNFFYCNPQEQLSGSKRFATNGTRDPRESHYTWRRQYTKKCACCPPKVMRALAMSAEMAYNVNHEGLWVNLYGDNSVRVDLPKGGAVQCRQSSVYPWDGKVRLVLEKVPDAEPFGLFLRIPGWVNGPVSIAVNGEPMDSGAKSGTYHRIQRKWKNGDRVEMELPMPVRFMTANPKVQDDRGKVAVMRGPVVYCLEGDDVPKDVGFEHVYIPAGAELKPVFTAELGGVLKLSGSLVHSTNARLSADKLADDETETALYRQARFATAHNTLAEGDRAVTVTMIPYYARLNRKSDTFKIWLPVY